MPKKAVASSKSLVIGSGWVGSRNLVVMTSELPELNDSGSEHTKLLFYNYGEWSNHSFLWGAAAMTGRTKPDLEVLVLGADGDLLMMKNSGFTEETVADVDRLPGHLRDIRFVGKTPFVVGMGRTAFRRESPGSWSPLSAGLPPPGQEIAGFNSIAGFSETDLYAAGLTGDLWHYDGKIWKELDSPTNVSLDRILCVEPSQIYVVGAEGTLLRRTGKRFESVDHGGTTENFYGAAWFKGHLYVAGRQLYRLDGDDLEPVDVGLGSGFTFGQLDANDGVLWSFGPRSLAFTEDGRTWTQVILK